MNSGKQLSEFWLAKSSEPRKLSLNSKKTRLSNCKLAERMLQNATVIGTYAYNIYIYSILEVFLSMQAQVQMLVQCRAGGSISLEQYCQAQDADSMQYDMEC